MPTGNCGHEAKTKQFGEIPVNKIKQLKEKSFFEKKRVSLELSDGKKRYLTELKTQEQFYELRKMFIEIGI